MRDATSSFAVAGAAEEGGQRGDRPSNLLRDGPCPPKIVHVIMRMRGGDTVNLEPSPCGASERYVDGCYGIHGV